MASLLTTGKTVDTNINQKHEVFFMKCLFILNTVH